ncbi:MAG: hypothetical protein AAGI01_17960, partial [Myxococcota bacterium]
MTSTTPARLGPVTLPQRGVSVGDLRASGVPGAPDCTVLTDPVRLGNGHALAELADRALAGRHTLLLGDEGVGKTRLLEDLAAAVAGRPVVLDGDAQRRSRRQTVTMPQGDGALALVYVAEAGPPSRLTDGLTRALHELSRYAGQTVTRIQLERFDAASAKSLARSIVQTDETLAQLLAERSAGNPMHLLVLLRYLIEEKLVAQSAGGEAWEAKDVEGIREAVPPGLAELFRARIHQVAQDSGRLEALLIRCALLGRRFSYDVLEAMIELEGDEHLLEHFDEDFDAILGEGLITEVVGRGDEWYTFSSGLLRDVLLKGLTGPARRRKLHRYAAVALERTRGGAAGGWAAEIAGHWDAARRPSEAMLWYWRAAQAARRAFLPRQALGAYQRLVELMDVKLGLDPDVEPAEQVLLDRELFEHAGVGRSRYMRAIVYQGDTFEGLGQFDEAERAFRRVVRMTGPATPELPLEVLVPLCQSWLGLGHIAWQRGDF